MMSGHPGQNWPHTLDKAEIAHVNRRYHSQVPAVDIGESTHGVPQPGVGSEALGTKADTVFFFFFFNFLFM